MVPGRVFSKDVPSQHITMGCIGMGRMGQGDLRSFLGFHDLRVLAVCDVDRNRAEDAKRIVDNAYAGRGEQGQGKGCDVYGDYRELLERADIDSVMICTPDHWHALPAIAAARRGMDIFLEKPLTLTVEEGRLLSDTVQLYGRILQVGSQQRSDSRFRFACELVRNGRIGGLEKVLVGVDVDPATGLRPSMPVPEHLDYEFWLGPAPWYPYTEDRVHPEKGYGRPGWLRVRDYGAGMITGWGAHHMDIAHWGAGLDRWGPVTVEGSAEFPRDGIWDVHGPFEIKYTYENGLQIIFADNKKNPQGIQFIGSDGWVRVARGQITAEPQSLLKEVIGPKEIHLYKSQDHKANFLECVRSRRETVASVEVGHRSCSVCLLGDIAIRLGRKLRWDPAQERFMDDDEANRRLSVPMRAPWTLG